MSKYKHHEDSGFLYFMVEHEPSERPCGISYCCNNCAHWGRFFAWVVECRSLKYQSKWASKQGNQHKHKYIYIYTYIYICVHIHMYIKNIEITRQIMNTIMHTYIDVNTAMNMSVNTYNRVCVCVFVCVYTYICLYIYIYNFYIYIYICKYLPGELALVYIKLGLDAALPSLGPGAGNPAGILSLPCQRRSSERYPWVSKYTAVFHKSGALLYGYPCNKSATVFGQYWVPDIPEGPVRVPVWN